MKLDLINFVKGNSALFDAKNIFLELKVGIPTVFSAENLIVGHVAVDVPDSKQAFEYLTHKKVSFEINVSVPKGVGKAESEGGSNDNTLGQAFVRDPDGYYLEICNCYLLTDFVLGLSDDQVLNDYEDGTKTANTVWASTLLKMKAQRSKKMLKSFHSLPSSTSVSSSSPQNEREKEADSTILKNFIKRRAVYGDICQSFSPEELEDILCQSGNNAGVAICIMQDWIKSGKVSKVYKPPAYYVGSVDQSTIYKPKTLAVEAFEKGKTMETPAKLTAGVAYFSKTNDESENEEKKEDDFEQSFSTINFSIASMNHIAFIVSDVGKSTYFYSDILGLQQVKRPNFDRHGAWFTGGNVEFHLILGNPLAPDRTAKSSEKGKQKSKLQFGARLRKGTQRAKCIFQQFRSTSAVVDRKNKEHNSRRVLTNS